MTQQDRSSDGDLENEPTLVGKPQRGKRTPTESGPAPRGTAEDMEIDIDVEDAEASRDPSDDPALEGWENSALYQRLLRNGALDEVMEVAAQEQAERPGETLDDTVDPEDENTARGPVSEVVPKGPRADTSAAQAELRTPAHPEKEAPATRPEPEAPVSVDVEVEEDDRPTLELDSTPRPLPLNAPTPELPSMMLGADASSRADSTQRVVLREAGEEATEQPPAERAPSPTEERCEEPASKSLVLLLALLFVAAGVLGFYLWTGYAGPEQAPAASASPQTGAAAPAAPMVVSSEADPGTGTSAETDPGGEEPVPDDPAPDQPEVSAAAPAAETRADERRRVGDPGGARRRQAQREPKAEGVAAAEEAPADSAEPGLPEQPARENVVEVMTALGPAFDKCVGEAHGDVRLVMSVGGDGKVVHAVVRGDLEGSPAGSCLARKAREARFEPFTQRRLRVVYPLRF